MYDTSQTFIENANFLTKFAIGYSVTIVAGIISYPLDTIRRRMMMTSGTASSGKYKGSMDCFRKIMAEEGMSSLFKGAGSNILRGLCGALVLVGFDYVSDFYLKWRYGANAVCA
jgi:solute carrier family 25 (adenine nucleotide translocator) protein 4/5/6/31